MPTRPKRKPHSRRQWDELDDRIRKSFDHPNPLAIQNARNQLAVIFNVDDGSVTEDQKRVARLVVSSAQVFYATLELWEEVRKP